MSLADELNWARDGTRASIRGKAVSPVELLRSCLEAIERLNAFSERELYSSFERCRSVSGSMRRPTRQSVTPDRPQIA